MLGLCAVWQLVTSFCVTVSMMVPKAGIVDILTELKAAGEQDKGFIIHSHCVTVSFRYSPISPLVCQEFE